MTRRIPRIIPLLNAGWYKVSQNDSWKAFTRAREEYPDADFVPMKFLEGN